MTDQNQPVQPFDAFVKKNKFGLIAAAVVGLVIYANAGNSTPQQPGNGAPVVQGPQQGPRQGPQQGPQQDGPLVQGDGAGPYAGGGDIPYSGPVSGDGGVTAGPADGGGTVDMDEWRRRQAQDDEQQRRRIETIREEERCRNDDGTVDTVSIHTGC
jgi:hypothetical protein